MTEITLSNINNIFSAEEVRGSTSRWRPLNTIICGIFSEYVFNELLLSTDESLFYHIKSFYEDGNVSVNELIERFRDVVELTEAISFLNISDKSSDNYERIINNIIWNSVDGVNEYKIGAFVFKSKITFIKQYSDKNEIYCLSYNGNLNRPRFLSISCRVDSLHYCEDTDRISQFANDVPTAMASVGTMSDVTFFDLTSDLRTSEKKQREAITADIDKNLLVVAGAGSGKTRSLIGRMSYLHLVRGIPLNRMVLLTFTKAATRSMQLAGMSQLNEAYAKYDCGVQMRPIICAYTLDAFFKRIIEAEWATIGFSQKPEFLFDKSYENERYGLLYDVINENHLGGMLTKLDVSQLYKKIADYANGVYVNVPGIETLLNLYIDKQMDECRVVDFVFTGCILRKVLNDKKNNLLEKICKSYDCILIDEFQDINKLQNDVLSFFYDTNIHFTFVGDDDQSIYAWRGADNEIIRELQNDNRTNIVYLTINYRNNPYIVKAGNDILKTMDDSAKKGLIIEPYKKNGSKVHLSTYDGDYRNLAHEVHRIYESKKKEDKICILCRNINDKTTRDGKVEGEGTKIKRALSLENVPVITFDSNEELLLSDGYVILKHLLMIFNKMMVKNNLDSLIEYVGCDMTSTSLSQILKGKRKLSEADIDPYSSKRIQLYHISKLADSINPRTSFAKNFIDLISNYNRAFADIVENNHSIEKIVRDCTLSSFYVFVEGYNLPYPVDKWAIDNIFRKFEESLIKGSKKSSDLDVPDGVIISSIHGAKGLEYNTVFIVGLNEEEYPNIGMINWAHKKNKQELYELEKSKMYLDQLRSGVTPEFIKEMVGECESDEESKEVQDSLLKMKDTINENFDDIIGLTKTGIEIYMDAYYYYVDEHLFKFRCKIDNLNKECHSLSEQTDEIEDSIFDMDENLDEYKEYVSKIISLNEIKEKKQIELENVKKEKDEFKKSKCQLYNYFKYCVDADGYLRDIESIANIKSLITRLEQNKLTKIREEKRLFYVAVSRAIDNLYLCTETTKTPSQFVTLISSEYCDNYLMMSKEEDDEVERIRNYIDESRNIFEKDDIDIKGADEVIDAMIERSDKEFLASYLKSYYEKNPQYHNISQRSAVYFNKAIQLIGLSERLGINLRIEILFNLERFIDIYLHDRVGEKALNYMTSYKESLRIAEQVKSVMGGCRFKKYTSNKYFIDLFSEESKYSKMDKCRDLIYESYVIFSLDFDVPKSIRDTWNISSISFLNDFLCKAIDLINIRNESVHSKGEPWAVDHVPYAFECIDIIINNLVEKGTIKNAK